MKKILISTVAACLLAGSALAQAPATKKAATTTAKPAATTTAKPAATTAAKPAATVAVPVKKTEADLLYEELLPSTAQIMFIDSVVVPKADFLSMIPITSENGILTFEGKNACYYNEFKTTKIFAQDVVVDSLFKRHIYTIFRDGDVWTKPVRRSELEANLSESDFPFLLADGTTFYFAGKGSGSVGGYDIFKTSYDTEDGKFLEPHNMGMPFSSKANDYLLAINDIENIGWLVSDRFQPADSVCIYTFEPTQNRVNISDDASKETLQKYAEIHSIKDTWGFGDRDAALQRLASTKNNELVATDDIEFVVDDNVTYTSINQFKSANGAETYKAISKEKAELAKQYAMLEKQRDAYNSVSGNDKAKVTKNIGVIENNINLLETSINDKSKKLRQAELSK